MAPEECRAARCAAAVHVQVELSTQPTAIPSQITGKLVRIFADNGNTLKLGETVSFPVPAPAPGTEPAAEAWARALYVEAYLNPAPTGWQPVPGQLTLMRSKSDTPINPAETESLGVTIGPDLWAAPAGAAAIVVSPPTVQGVFRDHWNELDKAKRITYIVVAVMFVLFISGRIYFREQSHGNETTEKKPKAPVAKAVPQKDAPAPAPVSAESSTHVISFYREHPGDAPSGLVFRKPPGPDGAEGEVEGLIECRTKRQLHLSLAFDQSKEPGLTYYGRKWRDKGRPVDLYMNLVFDGKVFATPGAEIVSYQKTAMHSVLGVSASFGDDLYQALTTAHEINLSHGKSGATGFITYPREAMKALADYCAN